MHFTPDAMYDRLHDRPFTPMRLITTAGQIFDIYHPELVLVGEEFLMIGTPKSDNPKYFNRVTRIALAHVTELRDLPAPAKVAANGD